MILSPSEPKTDLKDDGFATVEKDKWIIKGDYLVREHCEPRVELFIPDEFYPLRLEWLSLYRKTKTSLPDEQEAEILDIWRPDKIQPGLSSPWVGQTYFEIKRPRARAGWEWVCGRETKIQKTDRPPSIWPETWKCMNKEARIREIELSNYGKEMPRPGMKREQLGNLGLKDMSKS